jgi:hypothetical protein
LFKGRPATKIVKIRIIVIIDKQFLVELLALLVVEKRVERSINRESGKIYNIRLIYPLRGPEGEGQGEGRGTRVSVVNLTGVYCNELLIFAKNSH